MMALWKTFTVGFLLLAVSLKAAPPDQPNRLRVNHAENPLGIDTPKPLFGWIVNDPRRNETQTAYQVIVSSSRSKCEAGDGDDWDTGKIQSSNQNEINYAGKPLGSGAAHWWKVRTWNKEGQVSPWSDPATFETAFLNSSEWKASWIGGDYERYRTEFHLPSGKKIVKARAYISAKEIFDLTINGVRIGGDRVMEPGESVFSERMRYCTYDVTDNLHAGANAIGVEVGRGRMGHWWLTSDEREFILQLEVRFTDGSKIVVVSDKGTWKATKSGPLVPLPQHKSELFQGETYDARNEDGWTIAGYDDHAWTVLTAAIPTSSHAPLCAQTAPPMKKRELITARSITEPWPGVYVFDFGQKISGFSQLSVKGPRGSMVMLRHGDRLFNGHTWSDYTFSLNAKIVKGAAGMRFRIADDKNFYMVQLKADGLFLLSKMVKGASSTLKEIPMGLEENKTYAVKIEVSGSTIKTSIDGKQVDTIRDESFNSGKVGFWQHGDETAVFDYIFVEPHSGNDPARNGKYSIEHGGSDEGFWINRNNLKTASIPVDPANPKKTTRQFTLTDNETMESYDGGVLGRVDQANLHVFGSYYFADATDCYTLKGAALEVWEPRLTLHGFRYVEVVGYPGVPTLNSLKARAVHAAIDENQGRFTCSKDLLNKLHNAFAWTFKSSAQFGYVCDYERDERTGWVANNSTGEFYNFDMMNLYDSWLTDYQDTQLPDGRVSMIAPSAKPHSITPETVWLASYLTQPWDMYMAYGSKPILEKRYESIKKLVDFLRTEKVQDCIDSKGGLVNWATQNLHPKTACATDPRIGATACLYQCVTLLSKMAKELGREDDERFYADQGERIKAAFNARFLVDHRIYQGEKNFARPTQTAMAMALDFGLCPESAKGNVVDSLVDDIAKNEGHLMTGVCGTRSLLPALCDNGQEELAYQLATQTSFPSWGKWIVDGLNTCCEFWDESKSSGIYYLGGPLDSYFYKYLAGIFPTKPGYEEFTVKPHIKNDLAEVSATVNTVRGKVSVSWSKPGAKQFSLKVTVPVNAKATVYLPTMELGAANADLSENGSMIWSHGIAATNRPDVSVTKGEGDDIMCHIGSGSYSFVLAPSKK